jgi:hypothetical protein
MKYQEMFRTGGPAGVKSALRLFMPGGTFINGTTTSEFAHQRLGEIAWMTALRPRLLVK